MRVRVALKESGYPVDAKGRPDLRFYTDPLDYYVAMYEQHLETLEGKKGVGYEVDLVFSRRVHAMWGLIAKGGIATAYALSLLKRPVPESREDGAAILAELGRDEAVVDTLIRSLRAETDTTARDSIIQALGRLKNRKAIPSLAAIVAADGTDLDTGFMAVESLGQLVRKRFMNQPNPIEAAKAWIASHPDAIG